MTQTLTNLFALFVLSIGIYHVLYFLIYRIINKTFPKSYKDLQIEALQNEVQQLKEQNSNLSDENQKISEIIIRKLQ